MFDIGISGDGSWRKRATTNSMAFLSYIAVMSGKVVDVDVLSSYCHACNYWDKKKDCPEYLEWRQSHLPDCEKNHMGSAGSMEVSGAVKVFGRSIDLHGVRFKEYLGDGNCRAACDGYKRRHPIWF